MTKEKKPEEKKKESINDLLKSSPMLDLLQDIDEILERKISKLGNSAHISIPSKHIGKTARVFIQKKKEEDEN